MPFQEILSFLKTILLSIFKVNFAIAIATIAIFAFYWISRISKGLPPGPKGLPIIGYLPFIGNKPHEAFDKLAKKYGPVFSLYLGTSLVVVLNNYKVIKEALSVNGELYVGRPDIQFIAGEYDTYSIALANDEIWKVHRRLAVNVLRKLGAGKQSSEPLLMNEIQHFLVELEKLNGESTDFSELLNASVSNNICIMIFGKRFEYDDPWFVASRRAIYEYVAHSNAVGILHFFPWLSNLPGMAKIMNQGAVIKRLKDWKESIHSLIRERRMNNVDITEDNYMDAFLEEQKVRQKRDKNDNLFPDIALEQNVRTLMLGGTETTVNTLLWCIICMILYPEVQQRIQREIDDVIGPERSPFWNDRLRMPYTEATINEVMRFFTMVPVNLARRNIEDCELLGYKIPKNSTIMSNLWAVHNDKSFWKDPEVFRPERFLDANGEIEKKEYLIPFSMGKRDCPGVALAKMELHLYLTSMLQNFTFISKDGTKPSVEVRAGFTTAPKYFNTTAVKRNPKRVFRL